MHLKVHETFEQGRVLISIRKKVSLGLALDKLNNFIFQAIVKCSSSAQDQCTFEVFCRHQLRASMMKHEVWDLQIQVHKVKALN
jgi:hypothetical protein